jgi:DNA-binding transcriptional LysR family regulator
MNTDLNDLTAFIAVAQARGFRQAARITGTPASTLSMAITRLEAQLGVRLLNRTTRSVTLTEVGARMLDRLLPALGEVEAALDVVNGYRDSPAGTLRLNVPVAVARLVLPSIAETFLRAYPDIRMEVVVDDTFTDVLAAGADAGVRYDERLEQDMIAVPLGPRRQRYAVAAAPAYLAARGMPLHPKDLLNHACIRQRFLSGAMPLWEFERGGEYLQIDPSGPLVVTAGAGDMSISAAISGLGMVFLFEDWLRPMLDDGRLVPVLEDWWYGFSGPFIYYPSRRHMPTPLRAFLDFIKSR